VWNYPVTGKLRVPGTEFGNLAWDYHVAVVVCVKGSDGLVREMVIDPSLAREDRRPMTQEEWVAMQGGPDGQSQRVTSAEPYVYKLAHPENAYERGTITMDPGYQNTQATLEYMSLQRDLVRVGRQLTPPEDAPTLDLISARRP
jgi:Glutaminase